MLLDWPVIHHVKPAKPTHALWRMKNLTQVVLSELLKSHL